MRPSLDTRILALALARMVDTLADSFLVIVLPLYTGGQLVSMPSSVGTTLSPGVVEVPLSARLLVGVMLSLFGFLNSLSQPSTGSLPNCTGRRRVSLLAGLALVIVGNTGCLVFTAYSSILVVRAFQGLGATFTIPATVALVNEFSDKGERSSNSGPFNTFRLLGFGISPLAAGGVVTAGLYSLAGAALSSFDAAFLIAAVGVAVSFVLIALLIEDPGRTDSEAADNISISVWNPNGPGLDPAFAPGVTTVAMTLSIIVYALLANVVNERLDQGTFLSSVQLGTIVLVNVVSQYPISRLSDRYGRWSFLVGGFIPLLPTTLAQEFARTSALMTLTRFLQGATIAAVFASSSALAGNVAKAGQSGSMLSLLTVEFGLDVATDALPSGVLVGFGSAVPFVAATALGVVSLLPVYT